MPPQTPLIRDVCGALDLASTSNGSGGHYAPGLPKAVQCVHHVTGKTINLADGRSYS